MRRPRIAVVGSLNMDLVVSTERMPKVGETISGQTIHYIPGGKGANQAVGCARLGAEVHMIGAVGDDMFGSVMMSNMQDNGVLTGGIGIIEQTPTGIASILHTPEDNCIVIIPGANCEVTLPELNNPQASLRKPISCSSNWRFRWNPSIQHCESPSPPEYERY